MPVVGNLEILNSRERRLAEENINPGEQVLFCLVGSFDQALVALEERLLIIKVGMIAGATFGGRVASFHYKDITGIEVNTGLINGVIEISTPSYQATEEKDWWSMQRDRDPAKLSNCLPIYKANLKEYQPYLEKLREMIRKAKQTGVQGESEDITSQIEKLLRLYQSGALTEEEFQIAKKRLLEQGKG